MSQSSRARSRSQSVAAGGAAPDAQAAEGRHSRSPDPDEPHARPTPSLAAEDRRPDDTIKILLATDNHIGYLERDPIRGSDSFNTFREILQMAKDHDVDFVLLAGDLFHENQPTRYTIHQVLGLLREFSQGDKPVQIELLSDPDEGKAEGFTFPAINYEDYNLNVGTPVFSIHGNHDDPQGTSPAGALSAVDILSIAGLVNYFGKTDLLADEDRADADKRGIIVSPVLLKKGDTKLALYGIGNVKDTRLNWELRHGRVRMLKPADGKEEDWFNIVLVHQNRVSHSKNDYVPENMFDESTDLVIWGHEHDCRIIPEPVQDKSYWVSQPGSSVATSLAEGEALDKHVGLLTVQGKKFQIEPLPLKTVRPFVMRQIAMADAAEDDGLDLENKQKVTEYLRAQVMECVEEANASWDRKNEGVDVAKRPKPLIRLRVETTGVSELTNIPRFGEKLNQHVANPGNILQFHQRRKPSKRNAAVAINQPDFDLDNSDDDGLPAGQRKSKIKMADLVKEYLTAQQLDVLPENGLEDAVERFVEKGSKLAIKDFVTETLKTFNTNARSKNLNEDDLEEEISQQKTNASSQFDHDQGIGGSKKGKKKKAAAANADSDDSMASAPAAQDSFAEDDSDSDDAPSRGPPKKTAPAKTTRGTGTAAAKRAAPKKAAAASTAKGKGKAKATPAKGKGKGKKLFNDSDEEEDDEEEEDFAMVLDDDDEEEEEEESSPPKKKAPAKKAAAPAKKAPAKKAAVKTTTRGGGSSQSQLDFAPVPRASRAAAGAGTSRRKAVQNLDSDESE